MGSPYILWLSDCGYASLPLVGGKNASLGEMIRAGTRVPPGFAVTTLAYEGFLLRVGIKREVHDILWNVDFKDLNSVEKAGESIRRIINSARVPEEIATDIREAYRALEAETGVADLPVAVRSSATAEDMPGASFAGQQDTYLWIRGEEEVLDRVLKCWASLFTSRAISYRDAMGFPHEKVLMSVGVQKMANAKAAGVMFTLNPVNGDPSQIAIEANWGLGESVVRGEVTPDRFMVDKVTLEITQRVANPKTIEYVPDPRSGSVTCREVPEERQGIFCLAEEEVVELARVGKGIERYYTKPQDIEWAVEKEMSFPENVVMLQSRPETVWSQRKADPIFKPRDTVLDYLIDNLLAGKRLP